MNRRETRWRPMVAVAVCVLALLGGCGGCFYATNLKQGEVEFTVEAKERIAENNDGKYIVFTDIGTFQVTDNWLFGLTESSDRYNDIEVGATYRCSTIGIRWSLFSYYRNLNDCDLVKAAK